MTRDALVAKALAELLGARHVRGHRDLERRRLPGLGQAARDRLAERRERDDFGLERRRADRRVRRRRGGALDVLGDDPPFGARPRQARELDPALAGDAAGQRRRLDPAVGSGRFLRFGVLFGSLAAALTLLLARGRGRAFLLLVLVDLDFGFGLASTSSPSSPMTAIRLPTSISSPSPARIFRRTPPASASTSCVTLSVSSS